jgi:hypothetical protein
VTGIVIKITRFYFQYAMGIRIAVEEISLNTQDFASVDVSYLRYDIPSEMF